jgi:hypothetical protein
MHPLICCPTCEHHPCYCQVEESLAIFELAVEMSPGVSTYHSNLAVSYMRLKVWLCE